MTEESCTLPVRCGGCRSLLFESKVHGLLDAHSQPLHSILPTSDACQSLHERSNLYLDDENLPAFVQEAVMEANFTSGRLKCKKCSSRLGAFNYVKNVRCSCGGHSLPPVHLSFSKVDYLGYVQKLSTVDLLKSTSSDAVESNDELKNPSASSDGELLLHGKSTDRQNSSMPHNMDEGSDMVALPSTSQSLASNESTSEHDPLLSIPSVAVVNSKRTSLSVETTEVGVAHSTDLCPSIADNSNNEPGGVTGPSSSLASDDVGSSNNSQPTATQDTSQVQFDLAQTSSAAPPTPATGILNAVSSVPESSTVAELPQLIDYPDHLVCPICLELLFSPFSVKPCGHVFCEPCLRRLARPAPTNTACPLCREIIGVCQPAVEQSREVRQKYPQQCAERLKFEQADNTQHLPLPWLQNYRYLNFDTTSSRRNYRSGVYTRYSNWWRTALWIFWVDAIGFLLILTLNWFLSQSIHRSEQNLPSPPHLSSSRTEVPVLQNCAENTDTDGSSSGMSATWDSNRFEQSGSGDSSTDYDKERELIHPRTVSPIQLTTYAYDNPSGRMDAPFRKERKSLSNRDKIKQIPELNQNEESGSGKEIQADWDGSGVDGAPSASGAHINDNSNDITSRKVASRFFEAFNSFDDAGDLDYIKDDSFVSSQIIFWNENNGRMEFKDARSDIKSRVRRRVKLSSHDKFISPQLDLHKYFDVDGTKSRSRDGVRWWLA